MPKQIQRRRSIRAAHEAEQAEARCAAKPKRVRRAAGPKRVSLRERVERGRQATEDNLGHDSR
jgi:hypothetical protein